MSQVILEIGLHKWGQDRFAINFRLIQPAAATDPVMQVVDQPVAKLKRDAFLDVQLDAADYGRRLAEAIFCDAQAIQMLSRAREAAKNSRDIRLRIRLVLSPYMPYLQELRWETMCDPIEGTPLFTRDDCLFSRYLPSTDFRYVKPREDDRIRALVVIANPRNLDKYAGHRFAPIDVEAELERINAALEGIDVTQLYFGSTGPASADNIVDTLQSEEEGFDILYLVCHGAFVKADVNDQAGDEERRPRLWLEDEDGDANVVSAASLAVRLSEVDKLPKLAVLVSCESGGAEINRLYGSQGALATFGPRLVKAGIPAVVAMQGRVTMKTMEKFLPTFFKSLCDTGQIDLAMGRGRAVVRDRPDSWMPVLFMRLNAGRLWQRGPAAVSASDQLQIWHGLIRQIENNECTPILGSGLTDHILGTEREVASRWADLYRYPMDYHDRGNLPRIAQYLAVTQGNRFPRNELTAYLRKELLRHYGDRADLDPKSGLTDLIEKTGCWLRDQNPLEPHRVLASLGCPIFVTTNPDSLLVDALRDSDGIVPEVATLDWRTDKPRYDERFARDADYVPTPDNPLVYHLFGMFSETRSLVLSQDDYFEYLLGSMRNNESIPCFVKQKLADSGLMFIGFQLSDWSFRVLLQFIRQLGGSRLLEDYKHVAVQIDPEEDQIQDPEMARRYLREMGNFGAARVDIFWGSVKDFVKELANRMPQLVPQCPTGILP